MIPTTTQYEQFRTRTGRWIRYTRPTPAWWQDLARLHRQGLNDCQIARATGRGADTVRFVRTKFGLPANAPRGRPRKDTRCSSQPG